MTSFTIHRNNKSEMLSTIFLLSIAILNNLAPLTHASTPFILPSDAPMLTTTVKDLNTKTDLLFKSKRSSSLLSPSSSSPATTTKTTAKRTTSTSKTTSPSPPQTSSNTNNVVSTASSSQAGMITKRPIKVCYQGEPGAYSEKSLRELLGPNVIAVARPNFDSCYQAVASRECDYACLPFENSLGGSIHDNYDLMLRYDLTIVAEHECRVKHCLLAVNGVKKEDIKYCMSHPQALAQCDNYLRGLGITPIPMYDTAGSAKLLQENWSASGKKGVKAERSLPDKCTPQNTAAIASDMAGTVYNMNCLDMGIEDDSTNFTRFLLLGRAGVSHYLNKKTPSKTSIVFTLPDTPGALYKALACFSLREIDFSKIESRPTSASLLNFLKFKNRALGNAIDEDDLPRFRYCFYLDFLGNELDENAQNALHHLKEQAEFCRILGSYPQKSKLVGPVYDEVEESKKFVVSRDDVTMLTLPSDEDDVTLNVGIIGYGTFGQFLGKKFAEKHKVRCIDELDKSSEAKKTGAIYYPMFKMKKFLKESDVIILAIPLIHLESVVQSLPTSSLHKKLIVDVCPLSEFPKATLLHYLPEDTDIICSNPMFGPSTSNDNAWDNQPYVFENVRISDNRRSDTFLKVFERARCQMVQMTSEQQDSHTADAEFVTHLTGRLLGYGAMLPPTPVSSKEYAALCDLTDMTRGDSFDLFYGMYKYNTRAKEHIAKVRENLAEIERQLAAKEAYIVAREELKQSDRQQLISECRQLLKDVVHSSQKPSD